jgi:hypothetical protein
MPVMAKNKKSAVRRKKTPVESQELDTVYLLKLVMYLVLASQWLRVVSVSGNVIPIPVGFFLGLYFASHEHFQIDRKVEYAILIIVMFISYWLPIGVNLLI